MALLVLLAAGVNAAIALVNHTLVSPAPIRMLTLVEIAARALAAIAVVGHALGVGFFRGRRVGDEGERSAAKSQRCDYRGTD
jgi:hypothetical protein